MRIVTEDEVSIEKVIQDAEQFIERRNPEGLPLAHKAMRMAEHNGDPRALAYAKYILAFYHCLVANDYDKSIELCHEVTEKMDYEDYEEVAYKLYMTLGNAYQLKGELFSAQEAYMKGLKQLEAKPQLSGREKGFLASFYYNVSLLLGTTALFLVEEDYLQKAIAIYTEMEQWFKLSKCYVAYAGIFETKKEYSKSIELLYKALELDERTGDAYSLALTRANLGILHLRTRDFDHTFNYLNEALKYYQAHNMTYEMAMVKVNMGEAYAEIGKLQEGINDLLAAEEMFLRLDNKNELSNIYQKISPLFAKAGAYDKAYEYQTRLTESLRYFFDVEKTNALTRAKKEFETEQKEKEASLLREKNEQIRHYVLKLERSNNELKQFAQVASHDLREPLRMISAYMNLLRRSMDGDITEQQSEFIGFALDGAKRMEQLIVDLLRLAKVDANPRIEKVRLMNVVDEIRLNLDVLLNDKNAIIISSDLPDIMADRTMILQLFQNIIGNGIKYNENKRPLVKVKGCLRANEIELTFADNGIGIPEHFREKVFEIFKRLHTTQEYSGSGIGLSICRKIAESMNGRITIEDNLTGGTVFKVNLPISLIA